MTAVGCDVECYMNYFLVGFLNFETGKLLQYELSDRSKPDRDMVRRIMQNRKIITFNGNSYDLPMITAFLDGCDNRRLKAISDTIIMEGVKPWQIEDRFGFSVPRWDHIDLIEPQPNARASLKTLAGRLHAKKLQDLPIVPETILSYEQMDQITIYNGNDLRNTQLLFDALKGPIELREALGATYKQDFRSKSDAQIGEAILKSRIEKIKGEKIRKPDHQTGVQFSYKVPDFVHFETLELQELVAALRTQKFYVNYAGKVDPPKCLQEKTVSIGASTYTMGIGGLHSNESNQAVVAGLNEIVLDADVTAYYPTIILNVGLYPKAFGPDFLPAYRSIRDERVIAKKAGDKVADQGLKIALNGVFGKLGSIYSLLFAPHLLVAITVTGQLAIMMLVERAEALGISVVSANTDGVVFRCNRDLEPTLRKLFAEWESETGFGLEFTEYSALYSEHVNSYIAIKTDGKVKRKGAMVNPWRDDMRVQLMLSPGMGVCTDAVVAYLTKGTPIADYIRAQKDIRDFVTVVNCKGGGTWRGGYLGKVVRYIWSTDGDVILYKTPHPKTGNYKKVSKSDGCRPLMELPDEFPDDIDYQRYIEEAHQILFDVGHLKRPIPVKPIKLTKATALLHFAIAV
jgi:hypothetical protein